MHKIMSADGITTVVLGTLISSFVYLVGGVDKLFIAFVVFVALDYVTGLSAAFYRKEVSSRVMYWGTVRKTFLIVFVIIAHQFDVITGNEAGFMRNAMLLFIIGTEGVSILENCIKLKLPIPEFIHDALARMKGKSVSEEDLKDEVMKELEEEDKTKKGG